MRNLKRALSLTLASVMLLGMMVVGTSALSFSDADDISNVTAATVLQELGVMSGNNGKFSPKSTVTRGQMAILICQMLYGDKLNVSQFAGISKFDDVPANAYYTGYVNLANSLGIISGYGNGRFAPGSPVTTAQAALMLTKALGYFQAGELEGQSWINNAQAAVAQATKINMFGNLKLGTNDPLSRDNVAEMVFNAMTKAVPVHYSERWDVYYTDSQSILEGVKFNYRNTLAYQNFDLVYDAYETDDFQRPATEWGTGIIRNGDNSLDDKGNIARNGSNIRVSFIKAVNDADATYTAEVKLGDIYKDLGLSESVAADKVHFYLNGKDENVTTGQIKTNGASGVALSGLGLYRGDDTNKIGGNGVLTQVWYGVDDKTATITMVETYVGEVNTVFTASSSTDRYVTLTSTNSFPAAYGTLNNRFETESFAAEDLIMFTAAWNGSAYDIKTMENLELANTAVLTRWEGSSVKDTEKGYADANFTAGSNYKYSLNKLIVDGDGQPTPDGIASFDVNKSEVNVYLDKYGYAIYVSGIEADINYAAVIGIGASNTHGSETKGVTLLLPDGTQKQVTAKMDNNWAGMTLIDHGDSATYVKGDLYTYGSGTASANDKNLVTDGVADIVTYSIGSDGVYKLTLVGTKELPATAPSTLAKTVYSGKYDMTAVSTNGNTTFVNGKSEMKIESLFGATNNVNSYTDYGTSVTAASQTYYTTSKTIFMVATYKDINNPYGGRNYNVYTGYANAPSIDASTNYLKGIAFATNKQYTSQIDVVYIDAVKMAGVSGADTYFVKDGSKIKTDSDGKYYVFNAVVEDKLTTIKIDAEAKAAWYVLDGSGNMTQGDPTITELQSAEKGIYAIDNVVVNSKDIIESCDVVRFDIDAYGPTTIRSSAAVGTVKDRYDVLGIGSALAGASTEYWSYTGDVKAYYVNKDWKLTSVNINSYQTDDNDLVFAMVDDNTGYTSNRDKKLTHVFVKEVEPNVTTPTPTGTPSISSGVAAMLNNSTHKVTFVEIGGVTANQANKTAAFKAAIAEEWEVTVNEVSVSYTPLPAGRPTLAVIPLPTSRILRYLP